MVVAAIDFEGGSARGSPSSRSSQTAWFPADPGDRLLHREGDREGRRWAPRTGGFDRLVERGGLETALARSRLDASSILARIVFYVAFLFVLQLAFGVLTTLGPNTRTGSWPEASLKNGADWRPSGSVAPRARPRICGRRSSTTDPSSTGCCRPDESRPSGQR